MKTEYNAEEFRDKMRRVKKSKYGNVREKVISEGKAVTIDSRKEKYWLNLFTMQIRSNEVVRPVKVESGVWFDLDVNGIRVCRYKLDLRVTYTNGMIRHIDVKPTFKNESAAKAYKETAAWRTFALKSKLMQAVHGITIEII